MNYKNFIKLLEQNNNNNLNELPLKSIYRKLKRTMDTNFVTMSVKHTSKTLEIFGEKNNYEKCYTIDKKPWKLKYMIS